MIITCSLSELNGQL